MHPFEQMVLDHKRDAQRMYDCERTSAARAHKAEAWVKSPPFMILRATKGIGFEAMLKSNPEWSEWYDYLKNKGY